MRYFYSMYDIKISVKKSLLYVINIMIIVFSCLTLISYEIRVRQLKT